MHEPSHSALQLNRLTDAMRTAEDEHRQDVPLREDFDHVPRGCSCGLEYSRGTGWDESKQHLREVSARAILAALHRPCDSCLGTGTWHRMRTDYECPDCDGRGRTLTPLPAMVFQDTGGVTWVVNTFDDQSGEPVWALIHRDR